MQPQNQPNSASCLATALAIVMNHPVEQVMAEIGHTGMEIIFNVVGVVKYRGFHIQEMIDYALAHDWAVTWIEAIPIREYKEQTWKLPLDNQARMARHLTGTRGVLVGEMMGGRGHAVAWDGVTEKVIDPNGLVKNLDGIRIKWYFRFDWITG